MVLRRIAAVVVGIILAVGLVQLAEVFVHLQYPPPPGTNMKDMNAVKAFVAKLPTAAFALVLFGWLIGTLIGTLAAAKIGRTRVTAYIVGALLLCAGIVNSIIIPQPVWFSVLSFIIFIAGTLVGARVGSPSP